MIENKEYTIQFKRKKIQDVYKIIFFLDNNRQIDFYFDNKINKIQIFLKYDKQKISLENYKVSLQDEYDLSPLPEFNNHFLFLFKKYIIQYNMKKF